MKIIKITIIIMLIISLSASGCIKNNHDKPTITAKNAYSIARKDANKTLKNGIDNKTQISTIWGGMIHKDGKAEEWYCSFRVEKNISHYIGFYYTIYGNKSVKLVNKTVYNKSEGENKPILNWALDSDEAMETAKENPKISGYLEEYDDAEVDHMQLDMWEDYSTDDAVWIIDWMHDTVFDNPKNARAIINANTGEVIEAEADS